MAPRTCEICGERPAMFLCQSCESSICPVCIVGWLCKNCNAIRGSSGESLDTLRIGHVPVFLVAFAVAVVGFGLVVAGLSSGSGTGACFIWPLPFIVGCSYGSGDAFLEGIVFLGIVIGAVFFLWFLSSRWFRRPAED